MKEVKIEEENINKDKNKKTETEYRYFNYGYTQNASNKLIDLKKYYYLYLFILSIFIFSKIFDKKPIINNNKKITLEPYINYVNNCTNLKRYDKIKKIKTEKPYISVCLPVHNMEKYIERSILSIINQSFQNFEIIIVNDYSEDNTYNILQKLQKEDNRIKIITHTQKLGVYTSRIEAILLSKAKYIIFLSK